MNRGVLQLHQCLPVMAGGNPIWPWDINGMHPLSAPQSSPFMATANSYIFSGHPYSTPTSSLPLQPVWHDNQELPESLSQLMTMGGFVGEEADKCAANDHFQASKLENWEEQVLLNNSPSSNSSADVKQEDSASSYVYGHENAGNNCQGSTVKSSNWAPVFSTLSPRSAVSVTSLSSGTQDFSSRKNEGRHPAPDHSSETNSNATGGAPKKAKLQPSSSQSSIKVRKEKLGDRISALHQLVSPFGKTDTASVLLEAIGYIRFLQNQIEALSLPYMGNDASATMRHPQSVRGERGCIFPEDPGQLSKGNCLKRKLGDPQQDSHEEPARDLRSRGLCLVPVSSTLHIGSNNGADYWASAFGGGFQ